MQVKALDIFGEEHLVDDSLLVFRPAAYAVFIKDGEILVLETRATGKMQLPGGGIEFEETIEEGLRREVKEELGIDIRINKFIHFYRSNYFYNPGAWDCYRYFYLCSSENYSFLKNHEIKDKQAQNPQWIKIKDLNKNNFQYPQFGILPIIKNLGGE